MLIGYVRVSKADGSQTLEPQRDALLAGGVDPSRIYEDLASGRHDARPGLTACLKALQPGNTLVIWKLDRLGRDLRHLVITAEDLRSRGIGLKVLTGAGAQIDTTTANGRLAFGIFAAFAEFERELITERTRAALAAAVLPPQTHTHWRPHRPFLDPLATLGLPAGAASDIGSGSRPPLFNVRGPISPVHAWPTQPTVRGRPRKAPTGCRSHSLSVQRRIVDADP